MADLSRLCLHTITTKPWAIEVSAARYATAGVKGITVWRDALEGRDPEKVGRLLRDLGLEVVSLCRGGFFPAMTTQDQRRAIDENRRAIAEAKAIGAPHVVLVCGAMPGLPLSDARKQIRDGIAALLPECAASGVKLAIEPLHPMYADTRSAINKLGQANDLAEQLDSPWVGVAIDVYHVWWDPDLEVEIQRCAKLKKIFAYHICDWRVPTTDLLLDRGVMGEGCIPLATIGGWIASTGFRGFNEVEIFSTRDWAGDQDAFLARIIDAYRRMS